MITSLERGHDTADEREHPLLQQLRLENRRHVAAAHFGHVEHAGNPDWADIRTQIRNATR